MSRDDRAFPEISMLINCGAGAAPSSAGRAPLLLVVGPSGAGKDSLIAGAREHLEGRFHFARRLVTRPVLAFAEDHDTLPLARFECLEADGGLLLSWRAHGLAYGIPMAVEEERRRGRPVVANVSRAVVDAARRTLAPVGVVVVTAPVPLLAARLAGRGRESQAEICRRLERAATDLPTGPDVQVVVNDGSLEDGIARFVGAVLQLVPIVDR